MAGYSSAKIEKFFSVAAKKARDEDIFIPVLGPSGPGKSTFINNVLGHGAKKFAKVSDGLESCTTECSTYMMDTPSHRPGYEWLAGQRLIFVDTPGFDYDGMTDSEVMNEISSALISLYDKKLWVAGVIYMLPIYPGRMTTSQVENITNFQDLYGENKISRVALVTTRWNLCRLDVSGGPEVGERREKELCGMWRGMLGEDSMVLRLEDNPVSAWQVVDEIIKKFEDASPEDRIRLSKLREGATSRPRERKKRGAIKQSLIDLLRTLFSF